MAKTTTKQYNPVSTSETSINDGLSVRAARDHGKNANNYRYHAGVHKIIGDMWVPPIGTLDDTTVDLMLYLGKWWIPTVFDTVRWWITARLITGLDRVDYTLYSASNLYVGSETTFDSTLLWNPVSDIQQIDSLFWERKNSTLALGRSDFNDMRYFYLVAQNDAGGSDVATRAEIIGIDVQPLKT